MRRILALSLVLSVAGGVACAEEYLWCEHADQIWGEVHGSTVTIHHDAALYNCCPDRFDYSVDYIPGFQIYVLELEILSEPCDCNCCYDLSIDIADVAPGEYQVWFEWWDYETAHGQIGGFQIVVPDIGQSGDAQLGHSSNTGCLEETSVPEDPAEPENAESTWGAVKALYR
jgi:hypothetical protein